MTSMKSRRRKIVPDRLGDVGDERFERGRFAEQQMRGDAEHRADDQAGEHARRQPGPHGRGV